MCRCKPHTNGRKRRDPSATSYLNTSMNICATKKLETSRTEPAQLNGLVYCEEASPLEFIDEYQARAPKVLGSHRRNARGKGSRQAIKALVNHANNSGSGSGDLDDNTLAAVAAPLSSRTNYLKLKADEPGKVILQ